MEMIETYSSTLSDYTSQIPEDALTKAGASAAVSFTCSVVLNTLLKGHVIMKASLIFAGVAATASLIDSITRPIMNKILKDFDDCTAQLIHRVIVLSATSALCQPILGVSIISTIGVSILLALQSIGPVYNPNSATTYLVI